MIFKNIFAEKKCEKLAFLTQNKAKLCKFLIITLVFEKNAFFSQKIVIITSTPDWANLQQLSYFYPWAILRNLGTYINDQSSDDATTATRELFLKPDSEVYLPLNTIFRKIRHVYYRHVLHM
jgi:hypothetical protein